MSKLWLNGIAGGVDLIRQSLRVIDTTNHTRLSTEKHAKDVGDGMGDETDDTPKETHLEWMSVMVVRRLVDHMPLAHLATVGSAAAVSIVRVKDDRLATRTTGVRPQLVVSTPWRTRLRLRCILNDRTIKINHLWIVGEDDATTEAIATDEVLDHSKGVAEAIGLRKLDLVLVDGDILVSLHWSKRHFAGLTTIE